IGGAQQSAKKQTRASPLGGTRRSHDCRSKKITEAPPPVGIAAVRADWAFKLEELERAKGFEPSTPTLARSCSTPELRPRSVLRPGRLPEGGGDRGFSTDWQACQSVVPGVVEGPCLRCDGYSRASRRCRYLPYSLLLIGSIRRSRP